MSESGARQLDGRTKLTREIADLVDFLEHDEVSSYTEIERAWAARRATWALYSNLDLVNRGLRVALANILAVS